MEVEIEVSEESQLLPAKELSQQHEKTAEIHQEASTLHSVNAGSMSKLGNMIATLRDRGERIVASLATLAFLSFILLLVKPAENRVIVSCLWLLILFWCLSRGTGKLNADARQNRWYRVTLLRLTFTAVMWMLSSASSKNKLYLTLIMLADPLAFAVNRIPFTRDCVKSVWLILVSSNKTMVMILFKILVFVYAMIKISYENGSGGAGIVLFAEILACYGLGSLTLLFYSFQKSSVRGSSSPDNSSALSALDEFCDDPNDIVKIQGIKFRPRPPPEPTLEDILREYSARDRARWNAAMLADSTSPVHEVDQILPTSDDVESQNNQATEVEQESQNNQATEVEQESEVGQGETTSNLEGIDESTGSILAPWLCTVGYGLIVAFLLTILVRSSEHAQNKKLLWLSTDFPSGFFSIILTPSIVIIVEFVFDIVMASKDRAPSIYQFCTGASFSVLFGGMLFSIALSFFVHLEIFDDLSLHLSAMAWFQSLLLYYLWEVTRWEETLFTCYISNMIWYSISWTIILELPFFIALFTF